MDYNDPNSTYATTTAATAGNINPIAIVVWLAVLVLMIVSMWRVYTKAGKPGWASLVPFYNAYVLLQIAGRPGWWLLLYFIPLVNLVVTFIVAVDLAKAFGKGTGFGVVGLALFSFVGFPMLAFGKAKYAGPAGKTPSTPAAPAAPSEPAPVQ